MGLLPVATILPGETAAALLLAESATNVPLVAEIAAVTIEINVIDRPRELRGFASFLLGAITILGRPVALEMTGLARAARDGGVPRRAAGRTSFHA
jgi:hypothetical protein